MFAHNKLKRFRQEKGLTQTELMFELDRIGLRISRQSLINWESGKSSPNSNRLSQIAKFFNKPEQLFFN